MTIKCKECTALLGQSSSCRKCLVFKKKQNLPCVISFPYISMDHPDLPKSCQKCNTAFQAFAYYFLVNNERYGGALPLASGLYCSCAFPPSCEECHKISFGEPENSELYYLNGKYICESCKFKWFESASVAELLLV